jgi:hypothetical protein
MNGDQQLVEYLGSTIVDQPAAIVYDESSEKATLFVNTNSIAFENQGGLDWMVL